MTKPIKVGIYQLGLIDVALYIRDGNGGNFLFENRNGSPYIEIGREQTWKQAYDTLMHEACEMAFVINGLRYRPSIDHSYDNGAYLFSMNHTQFSEANAQAAGFLLKAVPAFKKAFSKKR